MRDEVIRVEHLYYRYPRADKYVLQDINFTVEKGEFLAVTGENGAGKTTLSLLLSGIIPQSQDGKMQGDVFVKGMNTREHSLSTLSQNIGIVLEDPETQLFTTSVFDEVAFGAENLNIPRDEIIDRANWALGVVTLRGYDDRPPTMLSGGQKQRVAIASALAMRPDILILDEPTSQLDPMGTVEVFQVVKDLKEKYGMTIVMVTHKSEEIAYFADKLLVLNEGKVLACGTPREIFADREVTRKAWITIPQVSELGMKLEETGHSLEGFPITIEECTEELEQLLDGGAGDGGGS